MYERSKLFKYAKVDLRSHAGLYLIFNQPPLPLWLYTFKVTKKK